MDNHLNNFDLTPKFGQILTLEDQNSDKFSLLNNYYDL